jgi:glycerol uptake facilitator protein
MNPALVRRLGAEALGTLILTFFGGAAVVSAALHGFDASLLGPIAFGFALLIGITVVGPVSGGHVNPTVTLSLAIRGRFAWADVPAYIAAQLTGGVLAGLLLFFTYGNGGVKAGLAMTHVAPHAGGKLIAAALLAEALGTFLLCFTVLAVTDPDRDGRVPVAISIGLSLTTGALAVGGVSGGSFNFARTFGPELIATFAHGPSDWGHIWVYLVGPVIGAVAAAYAQKALSTTRTVAGTPAEPRVVATTGAARTTGGAGVADGAGATDGTGAGGATSVGAGGATSVGAAGAMSAGAGGATGASGGPRKAAPRQKSAK